MMKKNIRFETAAIHSEDGPCEATGALVRPIYQTSTFVFEDIGKTKGYDYSRTANPTRKVLQDTLANFAAGVMILAYRPYDVGDMIECAAGVFGKVSHMSLVSTTILTIDNQTKIVPNGKIWGDVITNVTAQRERRVDLLFGIAYEDDIAHAEQVMWSVVQEHPKILSDPEPVVKLHELGDSSVNFVVRPWVLRDDYWDVYWDLTREVKLRFDREGISIPFPQRDVHFYPAQTNGASAPATPDVATRLGSERTALTGQSEPDADSDT